MSRLLYEADGPAYLERQNRARAMLEELHSGASIDVAEWSGRMRAIHAEVDPLPWAIGTRYRVRLLAGTPEMHHHHYRDDDGAIRGIDLGAIPTDLEYRELEGAYRGRIPAGSAILELDDGRLAAFADVDVLRLEEIG